jgi:agmatinase
MSNDTTKPRQLEEIAILGLPFDRNSSFLRGPAMAPNRILDALFSDSTNMWTENGIDLTSMQGWHIVGDMLFEDTNMAFVQIESKIEALLAAKSQVISLGGDHSITYPVIRSYARVYSDLSILQLDAHPDLYNQLDGNRYSHASPFARIMEEQLASRLVQVGIRTLTGHQRQQAQRFAVELIEMRHLDELGALQFDGPVYLSLDMDCLDPAFAPGVSHFEPGGMSTRQLLGIIQNLQGKLVGADIVEYNPTRDRLGITAMVAAKLLKELIGRMMVQER